MTKVKTYRTDADTEKMLAELCAIFRMSEGDIIRYAIKQQYDMVNGSPQVKELVELLQDFSAKVKAIGASQTPTDGTGTTV